MSESSIPVTVTVCGVSQLFVVKVKIALFVTVISPVAADEVLTKTFVKGRAFRTTVNVSVVPDSLTSVAPPDSTIVKPAFSLSCVVTVMV